MDTRSIGSLKVSVIGLGTNNFGKKLDAAESALVVKAALESGVTFFETADRYGQGRSEEYLGQALKGHRGEIVIATKFGLEMGGDPANSGGGKNWVNRACDDSLRRLGTDYIDLYQIHFPDENTPISETLEALGVLVEAGKVREVGCSNFSAEQIAEAHRAGARAGAASFVSVQNELSLLHREAFTSGVFDACRDRQIAFIPYFPLASGLLTGKYGRTGEAPEGSRLSQFPPNRPHLDLSERNLALVEGLSAYAESCGRTILDLAFAWLLAHEIIPSVIAGATSPSQVRSNAAASGWELSTAEFEGVQRILDAHDGAETA